MEGTNGTSDEPQAEDVMSGGLSELGGDFDLFSDDEVDKIEELNEKLQEEEEEIARAYAAIFSSPQGQKVIEDLLGRTLRQSVFMPERENPNILGHIREGQNSIVRYISQKITQGKEADTPSQEDDE